jgi:hypothetical protein
VWFPGVAMTPAHAHNSLDRNVVKRKRDSSKRGFELESLGRLHRA